MARSKSGGILAAALAALLALSCGKNDPPRPTGGGGGEGAGGSGGHSGPGGSGGGGAGGMGGGGAGGAQEPPHRDTSIYEGRLTWTKRLDSGVYVWDLPRSKLLFRRDAGESGEEGPLVSAPTLSADGSTLAYQIAEDGRWTVELVDLDSGDILPYPHTGLEEDERSEPISPSLSQDGRRVAVARSRPLNGLPLSGKYSIEVWDRDTSATIHLSGGDSLVARPILSADGERVLFLSSDEDGKVELSLAEVEEDAAIERLPLPEGLETSGIASLAAPGALSASADLRWVAISAYSNREPAFFLLDTSAGTSERIDILSVFEVSGNAEFMGGAVEISADGSTLAFSLRYLDHILIGGSLVDTYFGGKVVVAPRSNPAELRVIRSSEVAYTLSGIALSADGSRIAFTDLPGTLWVSGIDGSDPRLVASEDEGLLGSALSGRMYLSF